MKQKQELLKAQKSVSCWVLLYLLLIRLNASQFYVDEKQGFQMRCTGMEPRFLLGTEFYPLESALPCPSESSNRSINDLCLLFERNACSVSPFCLHHHHTHQHHHNVMVNIHHLPTGLMPGDRLWLC